MNNIGIIAGIIIVTGIGYFAFIQDKSKQIAEPAILGSDNVATKNFEEPTIDVPKILNKHFTNTDFSKADPKLELAISGGPGKDGIPAIDKPSFVNLQEFQYPDNVQAIVLTGKDIIKVYPYNILT